MNLKNHIDRMEKVELYDHEYSCVHYLFERQVNLKPDRIAIVYNGFQITFQTLNSRSNQLAHYLRAKGIGPESIVAIYVTDPIKAVIGILGILKAGGAYAPLSREDPANRINFILGDSKIQFVVVDNASPGDFEFANSNIIDLDDNQRSINSCSTQNLNFEIYQKNLAYVIHTSGTTAVPKGVAMSHDAFFNLISWHTKKLGGENLKTLLFTSLNFDASNQEIFSTLCIGGILYLIDDTVRKDPFELASFIKEKFIQRILLFYAPLQNFMIAANDQELVFSLCDIITAGEPIKITSQLIKFFGRNRDCRFFNMYGLTETHTVTSYQFPLNPKSWTTSAPIGSSIPNTHMTLFELEKSFERNTNSGEIFVSGVCLARGYSNHPELTADKFLPNPFGDVPGERMYRTGDLGRKLADGSYECLGRKDQQVKIRGYRVELGEVEAALLRHVNINEVAVIAKRGRSGKEPESAEGEEETRFSNSVTQYLIAYVVVDTKEEITTKKLRGYLKDIIPDYMIPGHYVFLEKLPLSENGKIDRNLLPDRHDEINYHDRQIDAPRTPLEEVLVELWEETLHHDHVGIQENFFELGGDSMVATRLVAEIRDLFQYELSLQILFENPTVFQLAKTLMQHSRECPDIQESAKLILRVAEMSEDEVDAMMTH